jgi:hypothetical protein
MPAKQTQKGLLAGILLISSFNDVFVGVFS